MNRPSINEINSDQLDELYRRIETLEHVAAGNKRHVQLIVPELEKAEVALERVRAIAERWDRYGSADLRTAARILREEVLAAPHDGPSVAECASNDRRWPLEKEGE